MKNVRPAQAASRCLPSDAKQSHAAAMRANVTEIVTKGSQRLFVASHVAKSLLWSGEDAFSFYVLVVVLKIDPILAGTLFLAGSAWNAVLDLAWGTLLAQRPALCRHLPVITTVAVPLACLSFAFLPLAATGSAGQAIALIFLFRTSFALFDVPHNALSTLFAERYGHLPVMRQRSIGSAVASLVVAAMAMPLLLSTASSLPIVIFAALACCAAVGLTPLPWLFGRLWPIPDLPNPRRPMAVLMTVALPILPFCLAQMLGAGALGAVGKGILHMRGRTQWVLAAAPLLIGASRLAVIPAWTALSRRLGVPNGLAIAYALIGANILLLPLALDAGSTGTIAAFLAFGGLVGGIALIAWTAFAQMLEREPAIATTADSSLAFGLFTATTKIGMGSSAFLAGNWLEGQSDRVALGHGSFWQLALAIAALCFACALFAARSTRDRSSALKIGRA